MRPRHRDERLRPEELETLEDDIRELAGHINIAMAKQLDLIERFDRAGGLGPVGLLELRGMAQRDRRKLTSGRDRAGQGRAGRGRAPHDQGCPQLG